MLLSCEVGRTLDTFLSVKICVVEECADNASVACCASGGQIATESVEGPDRGSEEIGGAFGEREE